MAVDHLYVWNRLVENKGPIGIKKDQQDADPRLRELVGNEGFMNFLNSKSIEDKMMALRDAGINGSAGMADEDLAQFLMTHIPIGLTEDKKVGNEAQRIVEKEESSRTLGALAGGAGGAIGGAIAGPKVFSSGKAFGSPRVRAIGALAGAIGGAIGGSIGSKDKS